MENAEGIAFSIHGEGEPVLLIHGSHVADSFLPFVSVPALADRFRLIRIHRRGLGSSARHTGPFSIEEQAADAMRPMRRLGIDHFHVVGHSYGAVTAVQLALDAPEAVRSLTLLEPPLHTAADAATITGLLAPVIELFRAGDARGAVDGFMSIVGGPDWRAATQKTVPGGPEQADGDAATFFDVEIPALEEWNFDEDKAGRISQPVLFAIGSESGVLFEEPKQLFLSLVPHAEEVVLPGLNHLLQIQDPGLVAGPIADFLERHPL